MIKPSKKNLPIDSNRKKNTFALKILPNSKLSLEATLRLPVKINNANPSNCWRLVKTHFLIWVMNLNYERITQILVEEKVWPSKVQKGFCPVFAGGFSKTNIKGDTLSGQAAGPAVGGRVRIASGREQGVKQGG